MRNVSHVDGASRALTLAHGAVEPVAGKVLIGAHGDDLAGGERKVA